MKLRSVDSLEILILADNHSDVLLPGNDHVVRPPLARDGQIPTDTLLAEHGLSLVIKVEVAGQSRTVVLDAGYTDVAVPHNMKYLNLSLEGAEAIVLSHGHMDHTGALKHMLEMAGKGTKLVLHPDVFVPRRFKTPDAQTFTFPAFPSRETLSGWGAQVIENKGPLMLADDTILVTGEVPRQTDFEKGMPAAFCVHGGRQVPDPFNDDQSLVVHVKDKGLAVISGCAHSGIINSVMCARQMTKKEKVYAVIGGFHLSGAMMAPAIAPTVEALKEIHPDLICPMHCTGFMTIAKIAREFPEQFVLSSVGSRILI